MTVIGFIMEARIPFLHIFQNFVQNPTVENAKSVSAFLTADAIQQISFMGNENFVLTSLLTAIAEIKIR